MSKKYESVFELAYRTLKPELDKGFDILKREFGKAKGKTMTHDALVRFAAKKVGGEVEDGEVMIRSIVEIGDGHVCPVNNFYQLTSPELMLKGMEVAAHAHIEWMIGAHAVEMWSMREDGGLLRHTESRFPSPADLPLTFWTAWYTLEKGERP